jgi:PAS domain S-box-containing protein
VRLGTRVFLATAGLLLATVAAIAVAIQQHPGATSLYRVLLGIAVLSLAAAAVVAWVVARAYTRPLNTLSAAAQAIGGEREPLFPDVPAPELARHALALRTMYHDLEQRVTQLRHEREDMRTLIESMTDGVIAANARGDIAAVNTAARRLLGYQRDDDLPPLEELFHDKAARALLRDVLTDGDVQQRALDLDDRTLLVTGRPLPVGGTLLVLRDITELRRLETVRRDFVANVSHELKTPLTVIVGYAETLVAEHQHPFADTILRNAQRMQRLVDELLDLSRIESGAWQPERRVLELEPEAREAWLPFAERAAQGHVTFDVVVAAEAHAIAADPGAMRQILTNLFDNALRHTPPGGTVRFRAELLQDGTRLSVEDTGSGVPLEHLPRIFERFYRVDPGRSRHQGGTGLGLAIVKHLVEAQGGRVDAESVLGRGTSIRLHFPV